jgi:ribose transport system permease protein
MKYMQKFFKMRESSLFLIIVAIFLILFLSKPVFVNKANLLGILNYIAENTILIGAVTIVIISQGLDLSVGAVLGLSGIVVGISIKELGLPIPVAILLTVSIAAIIGSINGFIISYIGINPLVTTLSTWFIILSLKFIINNGNHVTRLPETFQIIAKYKILGVTSMVFFSFICFIIFEILLRKNVYFRQNYYIGDSEYAAALSGIKVKMVKLLNYTLSSIMASLSGIFTAARFGTAYTSAGNITHFIVLAAVIIGGASFYGGRGSVLGSMLGLLFLALIYDAIVIFDLNVFLNDVVLGIIIVSSLLVDTIVERRRRLGIRKEGKSG